MAAEPLQLPVLGGEVALKRHAASLAVVAPRALAEALVVTVPRLAPHRRLALLVLAVADGPARELRLVRINACGAGGDPRRTHGGLVVRVVPDVAEEEVVAVVAAVLGAVAMRRAVVGAAEIAALCGVAALELGLVRLVLRI